MPWYRMPNGEPIHMHFGSMGNKNAPRPCGARRSDGKFCGWVSSFECDMPAGDMRPAALQSACV
jgi:hypothetical protein